MRILLAAVSSNRCMSGVSRHAANLVRSLLSRAEVSALHVLVSPWESEYVHQAIGRSDARLFLHSVPLSPGTVIRNLWYYRTLPAIAAQLGADVVHLAYPAPIRKGLFSCPVVTTLHDLYPYDIPANFGFPKVLVNRLILRQCLRNADAIACVSDSTRFRLGRIMPRMLAKALTIYNSVENMPVPAAPSFAARWGDSPFLLCVAQHRRNKNVILALRTFKRLLAGGHIESGTRLVVVGMPGPESERLYRFVRSSGLNGRVAFVSGISDAEISWCYRKCEVLLAPSIIEGFGLPVIEGQLAGCRVVCSDIAAFREVGFPSCRFVMLSADAEQAFSRAVIGSLLERRPPSAHFDYLSPSIIADHCIRLYRSLMVAAPAPASLRRSAAEPLPERTPASLRDEVPNSLRL